MANDQISEYSEEFSKGNRSQARSKLITEKSVTSIGNNYNNIERRDSIPNVGHQIIDFNKSIESDNE